MWVPKKQRVVAMATWVGDGPRLDGWLGCLEIFLLLRLRLVVYFPLDSPPPPIQEAIVIVTTRMTLYVLVVDTMLPSLSTVTGCRVDPMNHLPFIIHKLVFVCCLLSQVWIAGLRQNHQQGFQWCIHLPVNSLSEKYIYTIKVQIITGWQILKVRTNP